MTSRVRVVENVRVGVEVISWVGVGDKSARVFLTYSMLLFILVISKTVP